MIKVDFVTKKHFFTAELNGLTGMWECNVFRIRGWGKERLKLELTPIEMTQTLYILSDTMVKDRDSTIDPMSFAEVWSEVPESYNILADAIQNKLDNIKE